MTNTFDGDAIPEEQPPGSDPPASESPQNAVPREGRLMGLDYGSRRIGIAVSTPEQNIASPLENYTRQNRDVDGRHLRQIAEEYRIAGLVVGLPVHMSGDEGEKAREARSFGNWVAEILQLPVDFWDERYTSAMAEDHLIGASLSRKKRKARRDMLAAQILLQSYLDAADRQQAPGAI